MRKNRRDLWGRVVISLVIAAAIARCLQYVFQGYPVYRNYWGGVVFVPFAILILLLMLLAIWRSDKFTKPRVRKKEEYPQWPGNDWRMW